MKGKKILLLILIVVLIGLVVVYLQRENSPQAPDQIDLSPDVAKLQAQLKDLAAKNKLLYDDNVALLNKTRELSNGASGDLQNQNYKILNDKIISLKREIKELKQLQGDKTSDSQKLQRYFALNQELQDKINQTKDELQTAKANLVSYQNASQQASALSKANADLEQENKALAGQILELKTKLSLLDDYEQKIKEQESKITLLIEQNNSYKTKSNSTKQDLDDQLRQARQQIANLAAINDKNQKMLDSLKAQNEQFQSQGEKLKQSLKDQEANLKRQYSQNLSELSSKNKSLSAKLDAASSKCQTAISENDSLQIQNNILQTQNDTLQAQKTALQSKYDALLAKNTDLTKQNTSLSAHNRELELASKGATPPAPSYSKLQPPKKRALVETIVCDDLRSGQKDLSAACKSRISKALAEFSLKDIYEIESIVDDDGFTTLNTLKRQGTIPLSEFERLTKFANFGLGRDRAQKASEYIKSLKPDASVYLSKELKIIPNKRGFVLKIYR